MTKAELIQAVIQADKEIIALKRKNTYLENSYNTLSAMYHKNNKDAIKRAHKARLIRMNTKLVKGAPVA